MDSRPLVVAVDVQRLYRDFAPWALPEVGAVGSTIARLVDAVGCPLVCTRSVMPSARGVSGGPWAAYERRWRDLARQQDAEPALLDPLPELQERCLAVFDKHSYSAFEAPDFARHIARSAPAPLLVTGIETDICVLATVFGAVDRNIPVWLVTDALAGPDPVAGRGVLAMLARMPEQVRLIDCDGAVAALAGPA